MNLTAMIRKLWSLEGTKKHLFSSTKYEYARKCDKYNNIIEKKIRLKIYRKVVDRGQFFVVFL